MPTTRVTERVAAPFRGVTVDREAGVIAGVLVCGFDSANGRRYPPDVLRRAAGKYEGRPVNCDHAAQATCDRRLGWLSNVRAGDDGRPRADLNVLKTHQLADSVFEAAERNPSLFGLSHVALCRTRRDGGVEVIEDIESVESVDLVADPATTKGLHEHRTGGRTVKLNRLVEWLAPKVPVADLLRVKRLSEMDGLADLDVTDPATEPDAADPDDAIDDAFEQAGIAVWKSFVAGDLDMAAMVSKLKDIAKAHGKLSGGGESESDDAPAETPAEEGKRKPAADAAIREAIDVCRRVRYRGFDADDLDLIASAPADRRESVARRLMGAAGGGEAPTSGGRQQAAKAHLHAESTGQPVAADRRLTWVD